MSVSVELCGDDIVVPFNDAEISIVVLIVPILVFAIAANGGKERGTTQVRETNESFTMGIQNQTAKAIQGEMKGKRERTLRE